MPENFSWKSLLPWIVIAVTLVFFFNWAPQLEKTMALPHVLTQIIINWFPMLLLVGVWVYFLSRMRTGKWTFVSPGQKEQTDALKAAVKALERIAATLETRRL
jgi:hypothetical protein